MARYVCSDFHGRYDLADQAICHLGKNDHLFFLGDAIDHGPRSLETLNLLINHPQVTFFLGNHEDMMLKYFTGNREDEVMIDNYKYFRYELGELWNQNGGQDTMDDMNELREHNIKAFNNIIEKVAGACRTIAFENELGQFIILSHAGLTPDRCKSTKDEQLWDRDHFIHQWPDLDILNDTIIVHGHTPVQYLRGHDIRHDKSGLTPYWYCDNHKVCVDLKSAYSGYSTMLNIDTWESILLEGDHDYDL